MEQSYNPGIENVRQLMVVRQWPTFLSITFCTIVQLLHLLLSFTLHSTVLDDLGKESYFSQN